MWVQEVEKRFPSFYISADQLIAQQSNKPIIQSLKPQTTTWPRKLITHSQNQ